MEKLARLVRYHILTSTTAAGSGHPTSSLSATDVLVGLFFGGHYRFDLDHPENPGNDRLIFSKGHASPLFYSLYAAAGKISGEEMLTLRKLGSRLEGHPTGEFPYTEVPTGSLGQGLSVGVGMALNAKLDRLPYRTFVLLGDSEMAEGSVWEAMQLAAHYQLNNQRGETMAGHNTEDFRQKCEAFGWESTVIDGHNPAEIQQAFTGLLGSGSPKPKMIIARTLKGKGVSFLEDQDNWHGKALKKEELDKALAELGEVDTRLVGQLAQPEKAAAPVSLQVGEERLTAYDPAKPVATRKAYGNALANLAENLPGLVVLDAETSNSTYAESVKKLHSEKFIECYIAEQNMVGMALGFSRRGKLPFVSTFAAFLSRAFDQIRMSALAEANIKFCGSHAGVSIGEDGSSQMGLEEIAMFRALPGSVVLYPSDAISAEKLVWAAARHQGNVYIQTTRKETPLLYSSTEQFPIGGAKTLRSSAEDKVTVIGAGVTLHEALAAYEELKKENLNIRVIDLYSVKPLDLETLKKAALETGAILTVEDNHHEGGLAEAVLYGLNALSGVGAKFKALSVKRIPHSGKPDELLAFEKINSAAIVQEVKGLVNG